MANGAPVQTPHYMVILLVGAVLLLAAVFVVYVKIDLDFRFLKAFICAGIACLFYGVGSAATVSFHLPAAGQTASFGGAAAIGIFLYWTINDVPADPKFDLTYNVIFPGEVNDPEKLTATADIATASNVKSIELQQPAWGPAGPLGRVVKVKVSGVSARESVVLKISNKDEKKNWSSAALPATESYMTVFGPK